MGDLWEVYKLQQYVTMKLYESVLTKLIDNFTTWLSRIAFWSYMHEYRKFPKYSDTQKICCNHSKIWTIE